MILDVFEDPKAKDMLSRAWRGQVVPKYGIDVCSEFTVEEAYEVWLNEFGIIMVVDHRNRFRRAEFKDSSSASWFMLKWS